MTNVLQAKLSAGKVTIPDHKPSQINSLGAVPKPNGSV